MDHFIVVLLVDGVAYTCVVESETKEQAIRDAKARLNARASFIDVLSVVRVTGQFEVVIL